jgi:hypothetical protein
MIKPPDMQASGFALHMTDCGDQVKKTSGTIRMPFAGTCSHDGIFPL